MKRHCLPYLQLWSTWFMNDALCCFERPSLRYNRTPVPRVTQSQVQVKSWEVAAVSVRHTWDCSYTAPGAWSLSAREKTGGGGRWRGVREGWYKMAHRRQTPPRLASQRQHHISALSQSPLGRDRSAAATRARAETRRWRTPAEGCPSSLTLPPSPPHPLPNNPDRLPKITNSSACQRKWQPALVSSHCRLSVPQSAVFLWDFRLSVSTL